MKSRFIMTLACIAFAGLVTAQTQQLSGFKRLSSNAISPIFAGKEVKGYTLFYKTDKADKGNDNYHLAIYDQDLKETKTIDMQKPRGKYYLLGNAYNGEEIAFYFYNFKEKQFELEAYDMSLVKKGSATDQRDLTRMEKYSLQQRQVADEKDQNTFSNDLNIYPVPGAGFIVNGILGTGKGYTLTMYDNKMKVKWKYATDEKGEDYQTFFINEVNSKYAVGNLIKRPGMMSKKMTFYVCAIDVNTGKIAMEIPVESSTNEQLSLNTVTYEEVSNQIFAVGDYYNVDEKAGVAKSKGFYIKAFSTDGKEVNKKFYSWDKDVKGLLPKEANESLSKGAMNYTHKVLKGADGKFYLVCEQFSRAVSGAGIASAMMGGGYGGGFTKGMVWNMVVYVLQPDFALSEIKFYEKDKSSLEVPGADYYGAGMLGMMIKFLGGYDYQFTQIANDGKSFDVVYVNYDKEKGEDTKRVAGNIIISPDGKFNLDKIDITSKATSSFLYPAKPGYLMMVDWLKKERTLGMKLVKLNY